MRLGIVALVLLVIEARALAGPNAEELFGEAQRAYDNADYATAIVKWTQSYELSGEAELLFNIAQAYRLAGDCGHALATYKRFIAIDPKSEQAGSPTTSSGNSSRSAARQHQFRWLSLRIQRRGNRHRSQLSQETSVPSTRPDCSPPDARSRSAPRP